MAVRYALDASALLCLFNQEEGQDRVRAALTEAVISAVNYSEVVAKLVERGGAVAAISRALEHLHLTIVEFDRAQAVEAGALRQATRQAGLSFGDRSCLAVAKARGLVALTADQAWADLDDAIASRSSWCAEPMAGGAFHRVIASELDEWQRAYSACRLR